VLQRNHMCCLHTLSCCIYFVPFAFVGHLLVPRRVTLMCRWARRRLFVRSCPPPPSATLSTWTTELSASIVTKCSCGRM
jgi:hypothetical protein